MGSLPSTKRYYSEDFKESPPWFHRFLSQLDLFTEPIYNILNASVDLTVNTNEELYTLQVNNASSYGTDNTLTFVPKKFIGAPHGIFVCQCLTNNQTPTVANVHLVWGWTGSRVQIFAIYGLIDGLNHTLTLRIF